MTRPRKVQWADDDNEIQQQKKKNSEGLKKSMKTTTIITKKLVEVHSYSSYADNMAIEKIVPPTSPPQRKTQKLDRNLSTVQEEDDDDVSETDESG